jgi:hypothetical protein
MKQVLLEKLIVVHTVKKFPPFWKPHVHYRVHNSLPPDPIQSTLCYFKVHFNIMFPATAASLKLFSPFGSRSKI